MFCPGEAGDQKDLAVGGSFQLLYSFCCGMAARFFCCNTTNIHCGCREHTVSSQGGAQLSMCPCKRAYLRAKKKQARLQAPRRNGPTEAAQHHTQFLLFLFYHPLGLYRHCLFVFKKYYFWCLSKGSHSLFLLWMPCSPGPPEPSISGIGIFIFQPQDPFSVPNLYFT